MSVQIRLMGDKKKVKLLAKAIENFLGLADMKVGWTKYPMYLDKAKRIVDTTKIRLYGTIREPKSAKYCSVS